MYTVCSYLPDLKRPDQAYDFAVIAAGPEDVAVVGVDLASYGLKEENPFAQTVIDTSFDLIVRRVQEAIESLKGGQTVPEVLERVATGSVSNIVFRPFKSEDSDDPTAMIAARVFWETVGDKWPIPQATRAPAVVWGQPAESARPRPQPPTRKHRQRRYQVFEEAFA